MPAMPQLPFAYYAVDARAARTFTRRVEGDAEQLDRLAFRGSEQLDQLAARRYSGQPAAGRPWRAGVSWSWEQRLAEGWRAAHTALGPRVRPDGRTVVAMARLSAWDAERTTRWLGRHVSWPMGVGPAVVEALGRTGDVASAGRLWPALLGALQAGRARGLDGVRLRAARQTTLEPLTRLLVQAPRLARALAQSMADAGTPATTAVHVLFAHGPASWSGAERLRLLQEMVAGEPGSGRLGHAVPRPPGAGPPPPARLGWRGCRRALGPLLVDATRDGSPDGGGHARATPRRVAASGSPPTSGPPGPSIRCRGARVCERDAGGAEEAIPGAGPARRPGPWADRVECRHLPRAGASRCHSPPLQSCPCPHPPAFLQTQAALVLLEPATAELPAPHSAERRALLDAIVQQVDTAPDAQAREAVLRAVTVVQRRLASGERALLRAGLLSHTVSGDTIEAAANSRWVREVGLALEVVRSPSSAFLPAPETSERMGMLAEVVEVLAGEPADRAARVLAALQRRLRPVEFQQVQQGLRVRRTPPVGRAPRGGFSWA